MAFYGFHFSELGHICIPKFSLKSRKRIAFIPIFQGLSFFFQRALFIVIFLSFFAAKQ